MLWTSTYRRRYIGLILAVVATAPALAGCGGSSNRAEIQQTFSAFQTAVTDGDGTAACRLVTGELRTQMAANSRDGRTDGTCADFVAQIAKHRRRAGRQRKFISFSKVTVEGDHATATVSLRQPGGEPGLVTSPVHVSFLESDGRWRVAEASAPMTVYSKGQLFKAGDTLASVIAKKFAGVRSEILPLTTGLKRR